MNRDQRLERIKQAFTAGDRAGAWESIRGGLALQPDDSDLHHWAGLLLAQERRFTEAGNHFRKAIEGRSGDPGLWSAFGMLLGELGDRAEAETALRRAVELDSGGSAALMLLAQFLADGGRIPETVPILERVLEISPGLPSAVSGVLAGRLYDPTRSPEEIAREARAWCTTLEDKVGVMASPARDWDPGRKLRVGYLSADFREHSCAPFIEPLLRAHDRRRVEVLLYHAAAMEDLRTVVFRGLADRWAEVHALDDAALAERFQADRVDVLVDLGGHTAFNRLTVLARRPAPVQVSWLGYPWTTGLTRMDGRITDSGVDPPGAEYLSSEPLLRIDPCYLCWQPPAQSPTPDDAPCLRGGPVTFGSFNHFAKLNPAVIEVWSTLMRRAPGSRILLKGKGSADGVLRDSLVRQFQAGGVSSARVEFLGWAGDSNAHLELYRQVDVALDPFPYNGVTTTLEAAWMGVPVVALRGPHSVSRHGAAILEVLGLEQFVAGTPKRYVEIASALAAEPERLQDLRTGLRDRLVQSPICDSGGFAARVEALFRRLWAGACARETGTALRPDS